MPKTAFPPCLRRHEACAYLRERHGLSYQPKTLERMAMHRLGPAFEQAGRFPYYRPLQLDRWAYWRRQGMDHRDAARMQHAYWDPA
jgi:hypothetical protein